MALFRCGGGTEPVYQVATQTAVQSPGASVYATTTINAKKLITLCGTVNTNNNNNTINLEIYVNGSWVTCTNSNGTYTNAYLNTTSGVGREFWATWNNNGTYKNTAITQVRCSRTNGSNDGHQRATVFATYI